LQPMLFPAYSAHRSLTSILLVPITQNLRLYSQERIRDLDLFY